MKVKYPMKRPPSASDRLVHIALSRYLELTFDSACMEALRTTGYLERSNDLGLFTRDPEVAIYIAVRHSLMTAHEIVTNIERHFGEDRKPTVAEVKRFWLRFQKCFLPRENQAAK